MSFGGKRTNVPGLNKAYKNLPYNLPLSQMITKINQRVEKTESQVADQIYRL